MIEERMSKTSLPHVLLILQKVLWFAEIYQEVKYEAEEEGETIILTITPPNETGIKLSLRG